MDVKQIYVEMMQGIIPQWIMFIMFLNYSITYQVNDDYQYNVSRKSDKNKSNITLFESEGQVEPLKVDNV